MKMDIFQNKFTGEYFRRVQPILDRVVSSSKCGANLNDPCLRASKSNFDGLSLILAFSSLLISLLLR